MKLAVKKEPGAVPGGGYHYLLHPMKMDNDTQAAVFELMGYLILDVEEATGQRLLTEAVRALRHQVEVATITERQAAALPEQKAPGK